MSTGVSTAAAELRALLERFTALSELAERACDSGDSAALGAALDARDLISRRVAPLTRELAEARQSLRGKAAREAFDVVLRPVREAGAIAARRNAELVQRAHGARTAIGEQLDRLRHDDAARSAYASAAERSEWQRLDLTR